MSVLVTGGLGFIGLNVVEHLILHGERHLRILDDKSVGTVEALARVLSALGPIQQDVTDGGVELRVRRNHDEALVEVSIGDIRDRALCRQAAEGMSTAVHLAAHTGVIPSVQDPFHDADVNIIGTLNVLHAAVQAGVHRVVCASSGAPLGQQAPPFHEAMVARPLSPYGASKLAGEAYCSAFAGSYGLETVALRFSNAYGPRSGHKNSVIARFLKDAAQTGRLTIYGDGGQTRDFIYVEDIARAVRLALTTVWEDPVRFDLYQIGTGREATVRDIAERIRSLFGGRIEVIYQDARAGEVTRNYAVIDRARERLGFEPAIDLDEGLRRTFEWFKAEGLLQVA